jgi:hypothetical protein
MPVAAPALLVKLWIAKKLAVLLAVRAFGVKRLYRRGLKLSDYALGAPDARRGATTRARASARARWALRATCSAAMKTEKFFAEKAFRYMNRVWAQAGFSSRGMPGIGATPTPTAVPRSKAPSTASSASAVAAREAAIAASSKKKDA